MMEGKHGIVYCVRNRPIDEGVLHGAWNDVRREIGISANHSLKLSFVINLAEEENKKAGRMQAVM